MYTLSKTLGGTLHLDSSNINIILTLCSFTKTSS
jgi:hypothetical protein